MFVCCGASGVGSRAQVFCSAGCWLDRVHSEVLEATGPSGVSEPRLRPRQEPRAQWNIQFPTAGAKRVSISLNEATV